MNNIVTSVENVPQNTSVQKTTVMLPGERALELPAPSIWIREELKNIKRFGDQFKKLSPEQESVVTATVTLAQERENYLLAKIHRDFFTVLFGAFRFVRSTLKAPLFTSSSKSYHRDENTHESHPINTSQSFSEKISSIINLQNLLVLVIVALLTWSGIREFQDKTIKQTMEALKGQVATFESTKKNYIESINKQMNRADKFQEDLGKREIELAASQALVEQLKSQEESNKVAFETVKKELQKVREDAAATSEEIVKVKEVQLKAERNRANDLATKLTTAKSELAKYKALFESNTNRNKQLNEQVKQLQNNLRESDKAYKTKNEENIDLGGYKVGFRIANQTLNFIYDEVDNWGRVDEKIILDEIKNFRRRMKDQITAK